MCGIVGYIGEKQAAPILLNGLQKLEYRGYDSAGVAVYNDTGVHVVKSKGRLSVLDGILTSLKMMEVMLARKKPLSELAAPLKIYPQVLENVRVTDKATAQADPDVQAKVAEVGEKLGDTGRILVRESGTEPVLRVMVEAPEQETCQQYVDEVVEVIRAKGHVTG